MPGHIDAVVSLCRLGVDQDDEAGSRERGLGGEGDLFAAFERAKARIAAREADAAGYKAVIAELRAEMARLKGGEK